ncbi:MULTISPECIES: hypothetical protein [unclassified Spiroplasma]|uniref:hypothetical protein n=2 Tax=Spiroplasma TaxID=2132 RepID=UPI0030D628B2
MDKVEKKLDKKLYIGAKIGFITNIISIIWSVIITIILATASSVIFNSFTKYDHTSLTSGVSTIFIVGLIFGLLIAIGFSIAIIIMCNNVLKGNANSGLAVGIVTLVLAGFSLIAMFSSHFNFISGINIIFLGLNIASGVLLIIGKYLPVTNKPEEVVSMVNE